MTTIAKLLVASIIAFLFNTMSFAQESTAMSQEDLLTSVNNYYKQNITIFQPNSTVEDIDTIFDQFTDDFTYVHPKYGGVYTRTDLYNGYVRNQKEGGYDGSIINYRIVKSIAGLNAVVVERVYMEKVGDNVSEGEARMTLFEFKDGKIQRIFEYW